MKITRVFGSLLVFAVAAASFAQTAITATVEGTRSGAFRGSDTRYDRRGAIAVRALSALASVPVDNQTGLQTGRRQFRPITLYLDLDRSLPLFYNAFESNEILRKVTIDFWQSEGASRKLFTIQLENASISALNLMHGIGQDQQRTTVEVQLRFERVDWIWNEAGGPQASASIR